MRSCFAALITVTLVTCAVTIGRAQDDAIELHFKRGDTVYTKENGFTGATTDANLAQLRGLQTGWAGLTTDEIGEKVRLINWMRQSGLVDDVDAGTKGTVLQVESQGHEVPWLEVKMDGHDRPLWAESTQFSHHPPGAVKDPGADNSGNAVPKENRSKRHRKADND
jgi:hypothetical protein